METTDAVAEALEHIQQSGTGSAGDGDLSEAELLAEAEAALANGGSDGSNDDDDNDEPPEDDDNDEEPAELTIGPFEGLLAANEDDAGTPIYNGIDRTPADLAPLLAPLPPPPGTELSPFRRCSCIGTLPGRACVSCNGTHWHKLCPAPGCNGSGIIYKNSRTGWEPRSERCGFCLGRGTVAARIAEVQQAQDAYEAALAEQQRSGRIRLATDEPGHVFRRSPILPKAKPAAGASKQRRGARTGGSGGAGSNGKPAASRR